MSKKWLMIPILLIFIFAISIAGLSQYKYTQQSGTGYFVSEADHADALENQNELRMILDELGLLLEHSKYGDASYPADENTTPGTLDIFTDYYTKLEINALGYISDLSGFDTDDLVEGSVNKYFPGFTSLLADYSFTDNSTNWNTAYGWGDHSGEGYLTDITSESFADLSDIPAHPGVATKMLQTTVDGYEYIDTPSGGAGASELSDLSDVNTATVTNRYVLVADGVDFESRLLVEADISDLGSYLENVSEDTTPELGGELDAGANSIGFTLQTVAEADGTTTIDWKLGNHCKVTLGAQAETFTFTAPTNPCNLTLIIIQDSVGSRDITWPASVKWLGTEATWTDGGASKGIVVGFIYDGTNYWGQATPWES